MNKDKYELMEALSGYGYALMLPENKEAERQRAESILEALSVSEDPRLVEGFPVVLANCIIKDMGFSLNSLLNDRFKYNDAKKTNMEKLVLVACRLLEEINYPLPEDWQPHLQLLTAQYGDLLSNETVSLDNGVSLSTERLRNAVKRYLHKTTVAESASSKQRENQLKSFKLQLYLSRLFPDKQKELVLKKYRGEPLNKTEREYYSRKVRKKLEAIADSEVRKVAQTLTKQR